MALDRRTSRQLREVLGRREARPWLQLESPRGRPARVLQGDTEAMFRAMGPNSYWNQRIQISWKKTLGRGQDHFLTYLWISIGFWEILLRRKMEIRQLAIAFQKEFVSYINSNFSSWQYWLPAFLFVFFVTAAPSWPIVKVLTTWQEMETVPPNWGILPLTAPRGRRNVTGATRRAATWAATSPAAWGLAMGATGASTKPAGRIQATRTSSWPAARSLATGAAWASRRPEASSRGHHQPQKTVARWAVSRSHSGRDLHSWFHVNHMAVHKWSIQYRTVNHCGSHKIQGCKFLLLYYKK